MTQEELKTVAQALHEMAYLIRELAPDPEYMEEFGVDEVLKHGQTALGIITTAQGANR